MKKIIFILLIACFIFCLNCNNSTDNKQRKETEKLVSEANRQLGLPAIKNFQEKKLMKMIFELRDQEKLVTYAYIVDLYGKLHFIGKCIGFGLPYSVQYTNPERMACDSYICSGQKLPQPDPNGLFMPQGLSATWLMMIDKKTGKARPVYVEPQIIVSPFPLD